MKRVPVIWVVECFEWNRWRPVEGLMYRATAGTMKRIWASREPGTKFRVTKYASTVNPKP
jgi:hypothetical protein